MRRGNRVGNRWYYCGQEGPVPVLTALCAGRVKDLQRSIGLFGMVGRSMCDCDGLGKVFIPKRVPP